MSMEATVEMFCSSVEQKSHLMSLDQIEETRREVDDYLHAIAFVRNKLLPVSSLSPDVLSQIFRIVRDLQAMHTHFQIRRSTSRGWLSVAQVCRYWRQVALEDLGLWSIINTTYKDSWVNNMLERSKDALLSVRVTPSSIKFNEKSKSSPIYKALVENSRVKHLEFADVNEKVSIGRSRAAATPDLADFQAILETPAPHLSTFKVKCQDSYDEDAQCNLPHEVPLQFPARPFAGDAPMLQRLRLECCSISKLDPALLSNLVHLSLISVTFTSTSSLDHLLGMLAGIPNLQCLNLLYTLSKAGDGKGPAKPTSSSSKIVSLNRLEKLHLEDTWTLCRDFMQRIFIPASTSVSIAPTKLGEATRDHLLKLFGAVGQGLVPQSGRKKGKVSRETALTFASILVSYNPLRKRAEIHGWRDELALREMSWENMTNGWAQPPRLTISVRLTYPERSNWDSDTIGILASQATRVFKCDTYVQGEIWEQNFNRLLSLETLAFKRSANPSYFLNSLVSDPGLARVKTQGSTSNPVPQANVTRLPRLKTLAFEGTRLHRESRSSRRKKVHQELVLCKALRLRKEAGSVLSYLELVECNDLTRKDVADLRMLVKEVRCDEHPVTDSVLEVVEEGQDGDSDWEDYNSEEEDSDDSDDSDDSEEEDEWPWCEDDDDDSDDFDEGASG
ncbi:hypothetical protein FA15DRAFT_752449 [Coprinopsis marcescibilis]|uniref:Uncharacterized protein n=1 Tax=Coprinopsis marcescibilis TaxID=230819 RepID=A0A5C3L9X9_COPMA|nr:hypothetical protein FA15DRAFT_752449 [Coprinopsis marcescibilis]